MCIIHCKGGAAAASWQLLLFVHEGLSVHERTKYASCTVDGSTSMRFFICMVFDRAGRGDFEPNLEAACRV